MHPHTDEIMRRLYKGKDEHYTICAVLREIYCQIEDHDIKLKLRYACTLANVITDEFDKLKPGWLRNFYPPKGDFGKIMKEELIRGE